MLSKLVPFPNVRVVILPIHHDSFPFALRGLLDIGCNEELSKEAEEGQNVYDVGDDNSETGCFALSYKKVRSLTHHGHELEQLHQSQ